MDSYFKITFLKNISMIWKNILENKGQGLSRIVIELICLPKRSYATGQH